MPATLNIEQQHSVAERQRSPKLQGVFVGQEVVKNCSGGSHNSQSKGQDNQSLQQSQCGMPRGQEGDAFPTVALCAVQRVELSRMDPQAVEGPRQGPAESCCQQQAQGAVQSPLMEEVQSTGEAASEGELALDEEQIWTPAMFILHSSREDME